MTRSMVSLGATALGATILAISAHAADLPNRAVNQPDQISWMLFTQVVTPAAAPGNNNVLL